MGVRVILKSLSPPAPLPAPQTADPGTCYLAVAAGGSSASACDGPRTHGAPLALLLLCTALDDLGAEDRVVY